MKTVLHYLNWALYDFNRLVWRGFLAPTLKFNAFSALFYAIAFAPILIPGVSFEFMFAWAGITTVLLTFLLITYKVYWERRNLIPPPPILHVEYKTGLIMHEQPTPHPDPFTLKESIKQGVWWTKYMFAVLIGAFLVAAVFGQYIADFINYVL